MTTVVFADIVALLLDVLGDLTSLPTGTRVPSPRPDSFIIARRVGGERTTPISETTRIMFECWALTPEEADDLGASVRRHLFNLSTPGAWSATVLNGVILYRIDDVSGPADLPDELSEQPRAIFTVQVSSRGIIMEESD